MRAEVADHGAQRSRNEHADPVAEVRLGSKSEVRMLHREVGFALNNGRRQPSLSGPKMPTTDTFVRARCRNHLKALSEMRKIRAAPPTSGSWRTG
jgi:hypothetical protein